jgi:nucleoside-diphosphate-sugar epimerase
MAAVRGTGQKPLNDKTYTDRDWNTISKLGDNWGASYQWSKAESERRAWGLAKKLDVPMVSLCPSFVFGPPSIGLNSNSYSITLVSQWVRGESPVQSRLCVDVRDVARAHVASGTLSSAIGNRYIVSAEARIPSQDAADALKKVAQETGLGDSSKITFDADFSGGAIPIGKPEVEAVDRLKRDLGGLKLRPADKTIADMGRALLEMGTTAAR